MQYLVMTGRLLFRDLFKSTHAKPVTLEEEKGADCVWHRQWKRVKTIDGKAAEEDTAGIAATALYGICIDI